MTIIDYGIGTYPARRAKIRGDDVAISFEGEDTTYAQFAGRVTRLANSLKDLGVSPGDRVAYAGFNHPALLETFFATTLVGAACVLVNPRLAAPEVKYILRDCTPSVVFFGEDQAQNAERLRAGTDPEVRWFGVDDGGFESLLAAGSDDDAVVPLDEDDTALIMYTSGTTGNPKGVMLSHRALLFQYFNAILGEDFRQDDVNLSVAPLFHIAGLNMLAVPTFMMGGRIIIHRRFKAAEALRALAEHRVNSAFMVPAMLDAVAHEEGFDAADLSMLRNLMVGGAPLPERMFTTWASKGISISQGFGMTETAPGIRMLDPRDGIVKAGTAGREHFFTESRVVGLNGEDVAPDEPGEIWAHGPNLMTGYWGKADETAAVLQDGWYRTGDIGSLDSDDYLRIHDRMKDMYISGGENVYPAEVENVLLNIAGVAEAAVIGVDDDRWGESGVAFVVLEPGEDRTGDDIREDAQTRLAKYKVPREVLVVDDMPRTTTGKIRKNILRKTY